MAGRKSLPRVWGHGRRAETEPRSGRTDGRTDSAGVTDGGFGTSGNFGGCRFDTRARCSRLWLCPSLLLMGVNHTPQARGMDSIHRFLALTHTEAYRYLQLCVWDGYSLHLGRGGKKKLRGRPVSRELHSRFSLSRTVIMHKTSKNHGFIFAFNYFLAQWRTYVRLRVCESMRTGPAECTDRVLPPSFARVATQPNHRDASAASEATKGQIWSSNCFQLCFNFCATAAFIFELGFSLLLFSGGIFHLFFWHSFINDVAYSWQALRFSDKQRRQEKLEDVAPHKAFRFRCVNVKFELSEGIN